MHTEFDAHVEEIKAIVTLIHLNLNIASQMDIKTTFCAKMVRN